MIGKGKKSTKERQTKKDFNVTRKMGGIQNSRGSLTSNFIGKRKPDWSFDFTSKSTLVGSGKGNQ